MFGRIDQANIPQYRQMKVDVKNQTKKSIESLPLMSYRLNRLYVEGGCSHEFERVFDSHRFIYITVEALSDNCKGKIICKSDIFLRKQL